MLSSALLPAVNPAKVQNTHITVQCAPSNWYTGQMKGPENGTSDKNGTWSNLR